MVNRRIYRKPFTDEQKAVILKGYNRYEAYQKIVERLLFRWPDLEDINKEYLKDFCYKQVSKGLWPKRDRTLDKTGTNYEFFRADKHPFADRAVIPQISPIRKAQNILSGRFKEGTFRGQHTYFLDGKPATTWEIFEAAGIKI